MAASAMTVEASELTEELKNTQYQQIKGFNYVPSYAATIWDVIDRFDAPTWDREFGYSKRFKSNALRIWCDFLSFQRDEDHFLKSWEKGLELAKKHGLRLMIGMSNRWVDALYPYGELELAMVLSGEPSAEYQRYLKTFIGAFKDSPQVLMWDLCNEPFQTWDPKQEQIKSVLGAREMQFWRAAYETARAAKPSQPITIGIHGGHQWNPDAVYDVVDVISCHPYGGWWDDAKGFKDTLDFYIRIANTKGKPLIASETCQGSKNNETRTEIIRVSIRELEKRKIGWLAWQLMAGEIVTGRWDRTDHNCRPGDDSVMYFVEKDGRTRPGHEEKGWRNWS
jgi:hypothetical protein